jgi:stage IV sporulation protein FB
MVYLFLMSLKITLSFWLLCFFIATSATTSITGILVWMFLVYMAVLIHELGHALTARLFHRRAHIELNFFGGVTTTLGMPLPRVKEFFVTLMGPLFGFAFGVLLFWLSASISGIFQQFCLLGARLIFFWNVLNLIPILPLDGGKLLSSLLQWIFPRSGLRISLFLSGSFALLMTIFFFMQNLIIIGALFVLFAFESFRAFMSKDSRAPDVRSKESIEELEEAISEWTASKPEAALQRLENLLSKLKERSSEYMEVLEQLSEYYILTGQAKKALARLEPLEKKLSFEGLKLLQLAAYQAREYAPALRAGARAFKEQPETSIALLNAFSAAQLGQEKEAIGWLAWMHKEARQDIRRFLEAEELAPILNTASFKAFLKSL